MENNILDLGKIIKCMENKADLNGQMEGYILAIIYKIKNTDMEEYNGRMGKYTKANGNKAYNMEMEKSEASMLYNIKVNGKMEKESND